MPHPWHDPAITNAHSGHSGPRGWPAPPSLPTCLQLAPAAERVHTTSSGNHHNRQVLFQQQLLDVNVNDWIFQSKDTKHVDGQRNTTQSYVAYERLVLTLRTQTGSMWRHKTCRVQPNSSGPSTGGSGGNRFPFTDHPLWSETLWTLQVYFVLLHYTWLWK